jgi:hypothetical protein
MFESLRIWLCESHLVYLDMSRRVLLHFRSVLKEMRVPHACRAVRVRCKGSKKLRTSFKKISEACLDRKPEPVCEDGEIYEWRLG